MRPSLLALVAALGPLVGCSPPKETLRPVAAALTPLLPEPEEDEPAITALQKGTLVQVGEAAGKLHWKGDLDGQPGERSGDLVRLRRAAADALVFAFAGDLGPPLQVPSAKWLCEKMQGGPDCPGRLRRQQQGDLLLAYDPCNTGACRLAVLRGEAMETLTLQGLAEVTVGLVEGRPVLLAQVRWVRDPRWTGASTQILELTPRLAQSVLIENEEIDARTPPLMQRRGRVVIEDGALVFVGHKRIVAPTGELMHEESLRERYRLQRTP